MMNAPVVMFVYNRPDHTRRLLEMLKLNREAETTDLFVFSDGPQGKDLEKVLEVRELVRNYQGFKTLTLIERTQNLGIEENEVSAITEIVERYGKVIVVEDDLLVNRGFLRYMNDALTRYEDCQQVFSISGYTYDTRKQKKYPQSFFSQMPTSWGWGTWKSRWEKMSMDINVLEPLFGSKRLQREFDCYGAYPWYKMLCQIYNETGKVTWDLYWHWTILRNNGMVLYPKYSLTLNAGFDGSGVHCAADIMKSQFDFECIEISDFPETEEINVAVNKSIARAMKRERLNKKIYKLLRAVNV